MKRDHIVNPPDFAKIEGKLRAVEESLDGLLNETEHFVVTRNSAEMLASIVASVIVLHQVVAQMLKEGGQT